MDVLKTDVLVVGGGPAGSTTARFAALNGADVTLIEQREEIGVPVKCGELMPSLDEIKGMFPNAKDIDGLFDVPSEHILRDIEGIKLIDPKGRAISLDFTGYTTDRALFDQYLAREAVRAGSKEIKGCSLLSIDGNVATTNQGTVEFKVIVGADGPGSRVSSQLGMERNRNPYPAVTAQAKGDFEPYVKMFFGGVAPGAYSWIIPKAGQANVGVGFSPKFANGSLNAYFRKFQSMHDLEVTSVLKGKFVPSEGMLGHLVKGNGLLVGDAAGQVISVNGGGIPLAMIAGKACGEVVAGNLKDGRPLMDYEEICKAIFSKPLGTASRNKRLADMFAFGSDWRTGICMGLLGRRRLGNLIRCKSIFP